MDERTVARMRDCSVSATKSISMQAIVECIMNSNGHSTSVSIANNKKRVYTAELLIRHGYENVGGANKRDFTARSFHFGFHLKWFFCPPKNTCIGNQILLFLFAIKLESIICDLKSL